MVHGEGGAGRARWSCSWDSLKIPPAQKFPGNRLSSSLCLEQGHSPSQAGTDQQQSQPCQHLLQGQATSVPVPRGACAGKGQACRDITNRKDKSFPSNLFSNEQWVAIKRAFILKKLTVLQQRRKNWFIVSIFKF